MIGSFEAESALLGCLLQAGDFVTHVVMGELEPEDWTEPRHEAVFRSMQTLVAQGVPVDPVTVLGELRRSGLQKSMTADRDAGVFLADLAAAAPTIGSAGYYLDVLLEHRVRRQVEQTGTRLQQVAGSASLDVVRDTVNAEGAEMTRAFTRLARRVQREAS